jgi:hypothetical protein
MGKSERAHIGLIVTIFVAILIFVQSCRDFGTNPPLQTAAPSINNIIPDSAAVGDTIRIIGAGFGSLRGSSTLIVGSQIATDIFTWGDAEISAKVPSGAVNTGIIITVNGISSNTKQYHIIGALTPTGPLSDINSPGFGGSRRSYYD